MMAQMKKYVNNVNESTQSLMGRVAFGRRGNKASSVVIQRNPCKEKISIGTWNVRTMLRPGKLANVIREMRKTKLDILGLSEVMEGRMEGKRGRGRPRQKLLDWMMSEGYGKLKEEAQNREKWSHRTSGPARGQRT